MRYSWIDFAKVMALFLVVMGHLTADATTWHTLIYNFHMPFFFFLSGLLHKEKSINSDVKRLLIPYLLLNVLMLIWESPWICRQEHSFAALGNLLLGIIYPVNTPISYPTWFLLSLFEIKLLVRLTRNKYEKFFMALGCVLFASFVITEDLKLPYFIIDSIKATPYYIIGIAFRPVLLSEHGSNRNVTVQQNASMLRNVIGGGSCLCYIY